MPSAYYSLSSYNPKKRIWEDETTSLSLKTAKERAIFESKNSGRRWRVVKEEIKYVFTEGKQTNK